MKRLSAIICAFLVVICLATFARDPNVDRPHPKGKPHVFSRVRSDFHGRKLLAPRRMANPVSVMWALNGPVRDQGQEGSCTGSAAFVRNLDPEHAIPGIDNEYCRQLYWQAQREDGSPMGGGAWPGAKPFREGSSVAAAAGVAVEWGWATGTTWAFTVADIVDGLQQGPAVVGTDWWSGMEPDAQGFLHPTGSRVGGHCYIVQGCVISSTAPLEGWFIYLNSWGDAWGNHGTAKMTFAEAAKQFRGVNHFGNPLDGEAAFYLGECQPAGWNGKAPDAPTVTPRPWWDIFGWTKGAKK